MITLKGLKHAPLQRIFDQAARHLLKQNNKSTKGTSCRYRGSYNAKCAVGCFISDEEYKVSMEGLSSYTILNKDGLDISWGRQKLLRELQELHDLESVTSWERALKKLAQRHDLKFLKKNLTK
jgi:hypothetical protein